MGKPIFLFIKKHIFEILSILSILISLSLVSYKYVNRKKIILPIEESKLLNSNGNFTLNKNGYFEQVDKTPIDNLNHINNDIQDLKYIVIHGTGDYSCNHGYNIGKDKYDANRQFFSHYADTIKRTASWHFTVDDTGISQLISLNKRGFHASNKLINSNSIGIEICVNHYKNPEIFEKTLNNSKKLISELLLIYPNLEVIRHHDADLKNHKNCPEIWTDEQWKVISEFFRNENSTLNLDFLKNYTKLKVEWKNGKETTI